MESTLRTEAKFVSDVAVVRELSVLVAHAFLAGLAGSMVAAGVVLLIVRMASA